MPKKPVIDDFINFNKNVGPLQMLIIGYPGTGKSNQATSILIKCLERENECALMHGDIACEWRHYLKYSKYVDQINLILPKDVELEKIGMENLDNGYKVPINKIELNYNNANFVDYLHPKELTVVYDDCFTSISKTYLWQKIAHQLITRSKNVDMTITYLCHEAGNYYPQTAKGNQWEYIDNFCEYFVFFRKMNIRAMLLSQLENEVYDRLRKKCIWRSYRICYPLQRTHARLIRKYILKMNIQHYHLFFGDLYNPLCSNEKTLEIKSKSLLIPRILIDLNGESHADDGNKKILFRLTCDSCGYSWEPRISHVVKCPKCMKYFGFRKEKIVS